MPMINATNANTMKEKNKRLLINLIRRDECSRADLAKATALTKAAVSIIVDDLIKDGVVYESKSMESGIGRRPLLLKLNPSFMCSVGLNITRRYAELGIVDISGKIICEKRFDVYPKKEAIANIKKSIETMIQENHISYDNIYGVGVTAPGPVDVPNTTILNPVHFDEWHYENIGLQLEGVLPRKVYLENVSGGLALCEKYFGIAKKMEDFLVLVVDEGIGSGIMTSGKLLRNASELGHTSIAYDGPRCECGNFGCVEKYASIGGILQGTEYTSWKEVIDADDEAIIEKEAEYLSCAIINAVNLFSLENVILEGEINYKTEKLIQSIETKMKRNKITKKPPKIYSGSAYHGVVRAAVTVFDNYLNKS